MSVYDVHAHLVPASLLDELAAGPRHGVELLRADGGARLRVAGRTVTAPLRDDLVDVTARLERMDRQGVDVQLVSPFVDTTAYALDRDDAVAYARWFNHAIAEVVREHHGRFLGLGTVPLASPVDAAKELRHAMTELGMAGCEIATTIDGQDLDALDLDPFWTAAEELGAFVLLHPYASLAGRGVARYFLGNLVGNPAETTIAVAHLILSGTLERHPRLRLCVVHGGGFLPYQLGRLDRGFRAKPELVATALSRSPAEWASSLYYDTITHAPQALRFLLDLVGATQVVLGSDHPFEMGDPDPVATLDAVPRLTPDERDLVLSGNVSRVLAERR